MDKNFQIIGNHIKHISKERKMTQDKLAEKAGISTSYVYKIEAGDEHMTVRTLIRIAEALEVPIVMLLNEQNHDSSKANEFEILLSNMTDSEIELVYYMVKHYIYAKELFLNHKV